MVLDTTYNIATPEGVEIRLPVAGLAVRALAWLIDGVVKLVGLTVIGIVLGLLGTAGAGLYLIAMFGFLWFYNILFEVLRNGATPGKALLGIRVINENGTPVGWGPSILRNLVRAVDMLPLTYAFGCVSVLVSERFQRLGDLAARTLVVYRETPRKALRADDAAAIALTVPLSLAEQQAIVGFADRTKLLTPERQQELAGLLTPVLGETTSERLQANAAWLTGRTTAP